jgi:hypothetical protein
MTIIDELHKLYPNGTRVSNKELKATLQKIYDRHGLTHAACATHIVRFGFDAKKCKIREKDKRADGLILTFKGTRK